MTQIVEQEYERVEYLQTSEEKTITMFLDGPAEFLVKKVCEELRKVPEFALLFGVSEDNPLGYIDAYQRMDYPIRSLPAIRVYNEQYTKTFDSWFIEGDLTLDVIYPPNIRREDLQQMQDTVTSALLQQFRRMENFFVQVEDGVPGLNELGKTYSVDKTLGFEWGEDIVPLTQIKANFRIDLRIWDDYMESSDRTKERPFERTLGDLRRIVSTIQALRDNNEKELEISSDQSLEE